MDEIEKQLLFIVNDPNESWWVVQNALMSLSLAKPELVAPQADRLVYWLKQDEWWLRTAAMFALTKIVSDERFNQKIMPVIGEWLSSNTRVAACVGRAWPMDVIIKQLKNAKPEVQQTSGKALAKSYTDLTKNPTVPGGIDQSTVIDWNLKRLEEELVQLSGGAEIRKTLPPAKASDKK